MCLSDLARSTTRAASAQTYSTIALLVERRRREAAFRAYAYFRWVDDRLDGQAGGPAERLAFVERQKDLMDKCYAGRIPAGASSEEQMLIDVVHSDPDPGSPLAAYVRNMMYVMTFDAERRGRMISQTELTAYQNALAVGVTEAMYYFLDPGNAGSHAPERYLAVTGAHITHMLRDTHDDLGAGYYNIPKEYLSQRNIGPSDVDSAPYRQWVRMRTQQAREYFRLGQQYLESCRSTRCRLAAHAYAGRFGRVLDRIEADDFRLRSDYGVCQSTGATVRLATSALLSAIGIHPITRSLQATGGGGATSLE